MFRCNKSKYIFLVGVLMLALTIGISLSEIFTKSSSVEAAERQQWEYLFVSYSQYRDIIFGELMAEWIISNDPVYDAALLGDASCSVPFSAYTIGTEYIEKCQPKAKGPGYYLNLWGADGWELVSSSPLNAEYLIGADFIFKRLK